MSFWIPFRRNEAGASISVQGYYNTQKIAEEALARDKKATDNEFGQVFEAKDRNEALMNANKYM